MLCSCPSSRIDACRCSCSVTGNEPVGSEEVIDWGRLGWTAAGTFGAAACANTLNQVYEVASDAKMRRTMMRPLPLGKISRAQALAFAGVMGVGGTIILAEKVIPSVT